MGGSGSGRPSENWRGGRKPKTAMAVVGTGLPEIPADMPIEVRPHWWRLIDMTQGVAFSQDTFALTELSWLLWRQQKFNEKLQAMPCDDELNRLSLAIGRAILILLGQFGLTPRSRQSLLVPRDEPDEEDELERLQRDF